jgi:hypothetical protein
MSRLHRRCRNSYMREAMRKRTCSRNRYKGRMVPVMSLMFATAMSDGSMIVEAKRSQEIAVHELLVLICRILIGSSKDQLRLGNAHHLIKVIKDII